MRLNPLTGRWVTIVAERAQRPYDFAPRVREIEADPERTCPFCPDHEDAHVPPLEAVDDVESLFQEYSRDHPDQDTFEVFDE